MDTDRAFEKKYNRNGWPFLMVVDAKGQVTYTCNSSVDKDPQFKRELQKIKRTKAKAETAQVDGISYMASTLAHNPAKTDAQNDRFTSIAAAKDGNVYAVYTALRNGNSDIRMRLWDGTAFSDVPVAATDNDEYDAAVSVDAGGRPWVCWTSNAAGRYNIFLTSPADPNNPPEPIQITSAPDDVMHGRVACDGHDAVWVTYYQWQKLNGTSRDKEVYLRRYADGKLSQELQLSPSDVPDYEDHTDPAIACTADGVAVCWSWDYHKPKGYPQDCASPTIFVRTVSGDLTPGALFPLSEKHIDAVPALSAPVGALQWCAWDALKGTQKSLYVRPFSPAGPAAVLSEGLKHLCSPSFAFDKNQKGTLIWAETADGQTWTLARSDYNFQTSSWGAKRTVEDKHNPRYGSAVYDAKGTLWIAWSAQTPAGREVILKPY